MKDGGGNTLNGRVVTWGSSDETVATVDNSGNATSAGPGTATITATSEGQSGNATLEVDPAPVTGVVVNPPAAVVSIGMTVQLSASVLPAGGKKPPPYVWASSDQTIATVDPKGLVKGVALGLASISATTQGQSGSSLVTVLP